MMMDQSQTLNCYYSLWPPPVAPPPPPTRTTYISGQSNNWKGKNCHVSAVGDISGRRRSRWFHKNKKFGTRFVPFAPRNTTSFIIRAKRCGGIASRVSPCPVTPAVLPTPEFSPAREGLVDMAKEEWGVDGYGSMNGLIRLRSLGHDADDEEEGEGEIGGGLSDSDIEARIEMERRLDHDVSRFEMIYPSSGDEQHINRFDDQNTHIAQLQDENFTLRERLVVMEKELEDLRRRVHCLENKGETWGNDSENVVRGGSGDLCSANNSCINGD